MSGHPSRVLRLSFILVVLAACRAAPAAPAPDAALAAFLESDNGTPVPMLQSARDRVLLVAVGGRYTRVSLLAGEDAPVEALRRDAERAVAAAGLHGPVEIGRYPGFTRALVFVRNARPLSFSGQNAVRHGAITDSLRKDGRRVQAALRVLRVAGADVAAPMVTSDRTAIWYNIGAAPSSAATSVHVSLSGWPWTLALLFLLCSFAPFLALARGVQIFRRDEHPLGRAMSLSLTLILLGQPAAFQVFCLLSLSKRNAIGAVMDLWFASPGGPPVRNALLGIAGAYAAAFLILFGLKIFLERMARKAAWAEAPMSPGAMAHVMARAPRPEPETADPEERAIRRRMERWKTAARVAAFAIAFTLPLVLPRDIRRYFHVIELPLFLAGLGLVELAFRKKTAPYQRHTPDMELTKEAQALGVRLGVVVREAEVDDTWEGRSKVQASFHRGRVVVSRRAVEVMTDREMRFVLLNAIAGLEKVPDVGSWVVAYVVVQTVLVLTLMRPVMKSDPALGFLVLMASMIPIVLLALAPLWFFSRRRKRRMQQVMDIVSDPEAAATALLKRAAQHMPPGEMLKRISAKLAESGQEEQISDKLRAALAGGARQDAARKETP